MEGQHSVTPLMIVVIAAFVTPIILHRLRLKAIPVVVAEIIVGLVLGESGLRVIVRDNWLDLLSTFGIIYLMFLSGLEIDFEAIQNSGKKKTGPNPLLISIINFMVILGTSVLLAFGLKSLGLIEEPVFMTLIISTISLGVILPVLKEKEILETSYGQIVLLTAIIADLMTMILLAVYVSLRSQGGMTKFFLLLLLFVVFLGAYRLINTFRSKKLLNIKKETVSIGTRGVFALILFFVVLSEKVGAESILGAFLAGVIVSSLAPKKEFLHQLNAFGYGFLIPIFFVMVGAAMDLKGLVADPNALSMLPLLLLVFYLSKLVLVPVFKLWFNWKESLSSGFLLASTLSLVIAASAVGMKMGIVSTTLNTTLVLAAVITVMVSPVIFQKLLPAVEDQEATKVSLVGRNTVTLSLAQDLIKDGYKVTIYGQDDPNLEALPQRPYQVITLPEFDLDSLDKHNAFQSDIVIAFTSHDEWNLQVAEAAEQNGVKQVIARVENQTNRELPGDSKIQMFSSFFSNKTLLKAFVEYPTLINLVSHEGHLQEIELGNQQYHYTRLREIPFLGDILVIRIFRNNEIIVPHGDTVLQLGDRLIVSGSPGDTRQLKRKFR
ncbi:trk system potassium uptake protein TrkA [Desulfotomaculum arcticum]|uniref:Trk system potassium uptake protein TrkA n=1 Tax=Desulfotruncus arcticus DSM 17038 TaxID=1121424 RepID=A0A1I2UAN7_9FIRM|nr:monovalent cation:proton antiporter family protein [Desulfotruncus arcticus]SFG71711.1 trk system potassium uptake protein TrkA [Desulfotomaculum arcticum] [Desulfotruncus arcticus DSM 17038]